MKKKILTLFSAMLILFSLSACNLTFTNPEAPLSTVLTDDTTYEVIQTNITKTVEEVKNACVGIYVQYEDKTGNKVGSIGSGVIYKMLVDGKPATAEDKNVTCYVITNEHVINIDNGKNASYSVYIGNDVYISASPVGSDSSNDLAVLTFEANLDKYNLGMVDLAAEEDNLAVQGNYCIAIGCPLDLANFNYVSVGNISKVTLSNIMHTAAINPGNSGGALFSVSGKLIGINYMKNTIIDESGDLVPIDGMGYAIPIWTVKQVVSDIESTYKAIERPKLGVTVVTINTTLNPDDSSKLPNTLPNELIPEEDRGKDFYQGVVVEEVSANSNASQATSRETSVVGLQKGDVIFMANDRYITRNTDLSYELNLMLSGEVMTLVILRNVADKWQAYNYTVTLA